MSKRSKVAIVRTTPATVLEDYHRVMRDRLGIRLKPEVLPFSNIPAYLPPFLLRPGWAMTMAGAA